jgi:hypothetical protein
MKPSRESDSMRTITQQIRRLTLLFTIMTLALAAMPLAGSAQDTTDDQKERCKNGGWQELTDADGNAFSNQGECVKYVATGGAFEDSDDTSEEPPDQTETGLQLKVSSGLYTDDSCEYLVYLTGLTPDSGRFELWMKFGDLAWRELPMVNGWNGFSVLTVQLLNQVPATFTVYPYGASAMGDPIDSVTINACGDSA